MYFYWILLYTYISIHAGYKRVNQGLRVRGSWRSNRTAIFWPSLLWPSRCVFLVLLILNRRSGGPLCWVMASFTASYQHFSGPQTPSGFPRAPLAGCGFPYHISSISVPNSTATPTGTGTQLCWLLSWLSYIIIQRPHDRPLDLWNRMFNHHQAEITIMQFRGHSLPVHPSMRVSRALPCPISSANFRPRDFLS